MTTEATPGALGSNDQLGLVPERESVDDALLIVESYGPWGADLNDAHRRQIVLADEVLRLRRLYEMAVRGRAEMRTALRQERSAERLLREVLEALPGLQAPNCLGMDLYQRIGAALGPNAKAQADAEAERRSGCRSCVTLGHNQQLKGHHENSVPEIPHFTVD